MFMAQSDYENAMALMTAIEGASKKVDVSFVDLSELVNRPEAPKASYADALQLIGEVEGGGRRVRERAAQPGTLGPMGVPVQLGQQVSSEVTQQKKKAEKKVEKPSGGWFKPKTKAPSAPMEMEEQRKQAAAQELGGVVEQLEQPRQPVQFPEIKLKKKPNMNELVLPNLSIADQVSELEQIIEGLRENVFDEEHTNIVMQEVYGLEQTINAERKKLKGKPQGDNELERSLYDTRDQRLVEAATLLQQVQQQKRSR